MAPSPLEKLAAQLFNDLQKERDGSEAWGLNKTYERPGLDHLDAYLRGCHRPPYQPREAGTEYKILVQRSIMNLMPLAVASQAQALYVDQYLTESSIGEGPWRYAWQGNGMDSRQLRIHRAALTYGYSYATGLPGKSPRGERVPVIRGASPRKLYAAYEDPADDEYPVHALQVMSRGRWRLLDDNEIHWFKRTGDREAEYTHSEEHGLGVCPVVRYVDLMDDEGRITGEIEPLIPIQDSLNQTRFDLLMTQTFGSWKIRTVSGMILPDDTDEARRKKFQIAQDRFLVADDPDTKFGSLPETPLDGLIRAKEMALREFAVSGQIPPSGLLAEMINLSADALEAAREGWLNHNRELRTSFGESHEQLMRLSAHIMGDRAAAEDTDAQVQWSDVGARSLAQVADALGKIAAQLQVPVQALWGRIPGVTQTDIEEWKALAEQDPQLQLARALERTNVDNGSGSEVDRAA